MFYDILEKLCVEIKTTPTAFVKDVLKMGSSNVTRWKNGTSPNTDVAIKIANYFNVTLDYLLLGKPKEHVVRKKDIVTEKNLTESFYKLSDNHKERVLERIQTYLEEYEDYKIKEDNELAYTADYDTPTRKLVICGQTAAGQPITYPDLYSFSDIVEVPDNIKADFALTVKGDSMEPEIKNGSILYIQKMDDVENGTIAIIEINEAVTCKKFYRFNDRIELVSVNPKYKPIIIKESDKIDIKVIGKVIL